MDFVNVFIGLFKSRSLDKPEYAGNECLFEE